MTEGHHQLCTACGGDRVRPFVELRGVPVLCNILWPAREDAITAPKGDLVLGFCADCGHVMNTAFDHAHMTYSQAYENSLHFSPGFQKFAETLSDRLIAKHGLHGKDIIDIGCGKGDFLKLICSRGGNRGTGFDPSYVPGASDGDPASTVRFVREFYSERHTAFPADLISCRHVLEHIPDPRTFVAALRRSIGNRSTTAIYFEVPNILYTLRDMGIWDLIYEHCSYFSPGSLGRLFASSGFDVDLVEEVFGSQYVGLEAHASAGPHGRMRRAPDDPAEAQLLVDGFSARYREKVALWEERLSDLRRQGKKAVVWGGGSKGVTFLNSVPAARHVEVMVDINPRKQGMYVPGTGQQIVAPDHLKSSRPDVIIVMNPLYAGEILAQAEAMGIRAELQVA